MSEPLDVDELLRRVKSHEYRWKVAPIGRWSWHVTISQGLIDYPDYMVIGSRDRAVRKARRQVARYRAEDERRQRLTITSEEGAG